MGRSRGRAPPSPFPLALFDHLLRATALLASPRLGPPVSLSFALNQQPRIPPMNSHAAPHDSLTHRRVSCQPPTLTTAPEHTCTHLNPIRQISQSL